MPAPDLRHFTLDEYHRMAAAGILAEDDRLELIHGVIRTVSPKKRLHVLATIRIRALFARRLAGRASVYEEKPFAFSALESEPEPDIAVCSNPDWTTYGTDQTEPLLVIEVADSTVQYDLTVKAELYAQGGIPDYWVVDLVHRRLVIFQNPEEGIYRDRSTHEPGAVITPISWPDLHIEVEALFPPSDIIRRD